MKERDRPLIIALRLKVVNGQITEIEHVLARNLRAEAVKNLANPRPEFVTALPPASRLPRQFLTLRIKTKVLNLRRVFDDGEPRVIPRASLNRVVFRF